MSVRELVLLTSGSLLCNLTKKSSGVRSPFQISIEPRKNTRHAP